MYYRTLIEKIAVQAQLTEEATQRAIEALLCVMSQECSGEVTVEKVGHLVFYPISCLSGLQPGASLATEGEFHAI